MIRHVQAGEKTLDFGITNVDFVDVGDEVEEEEHRDKSPVNLPQYLSLPVFREVGQEISIVLGETSDCHLTGALRSNFLVKVCLLDLELFHYDDEVRTESRDKVAMLVLKVGFERSHTLSPNLMKVGRCLRVVILQRFGADLYISNRAVLCGIPVSLFIAWSGTFLPTPEAKV